MRLPSSKKVKKFDLFYQIIFGTVAFIMGVSCAVMLFSAELVFLAPEESLIMGGIMSALAILIASLGAYGCWKRKGGVSIRIATGLLFGLMVLLAMGIFIQYTRPSSRKYLSNLWDTMDKGEIYKIQNVGECCGFTDYNDRIQEPCKQYHEQIGCSEFMEEVYVPLVDKAMIPWVALWLFTVCAILIHITLISITLYEEKKARDGRFVLGERQPFDAWHKAVFH